MIVTPTTYRANDDEDMVIITLGDIQPRAAYQTAFEIAHYLRMACKSAARYDHVPGNFWPDVSMEDLEDCSPTHRGFRRSKQTQSFINCSARYKGEEVCLLFDGVGKTFGYEDGIKLHQMIRRAARRAKAWAGESGKRSTMLANMTNAAEDDRLGLG